MNHLHTHILNLGKSHVNLTFIIFRGHFGGFNETPLPQNLTDFAGLNPFTFFDDHNRCDPFLSFTKPTKTL
jgi:hypothetical protein